MRLVALLVAGVAAVKFAWLSDIHLDLLYNPEAQQKQYCRQPQLPYDAICKDLRAIVTAERDLNFVSANGQPPTPEPSPEPLNLSLLPAYHGRYGCDSPLTLYWSLLMSIRRRAHIESLDFVLVTGDFAGHYWAAEMSCLRSLSLVVATDLLKRALHKDPIQPLHWENGFLFLSELYKNSTAWITDDDPSHFVSPKLIFTPGNNDLQVDYVVQEHSQWNQALFQLWSPLAVPPDQQIPFTRGLYYRSYLNEHLKIVSLNTVWWAASQPKVSKDPGGQFEWLKSELEASKEAGERVLIVGHIPPSHSLFKNEEGGFTIEKQWHDHFNRRYQKLIQTYSDVIDGQYFGHFHTDEFRIQMSEHRETKVRAAGLALLAPGVCPNHGSNPSWRLGHLTETRHGRFELKDYEQLYTPLYGQEYHTVPVLGTFHPHQLPQFVTEYTARKHFQLDDALKPQTVFDNFWTAVQATSGQTRKYWSLQAVRAEAPPIFLLRCVIEQRRVPVKDCVNNYIQNALNQQPIMLVQ